MWIMVWILRGRTINLVFVFLGLTHLSVSLSLSLFAMGRLKNRKEMELCERIQSLEHLYLTLKM